MLRRVPGALCAETPFSLWAVVDARDIHTHRGIGYEEVFDSALRSTLRAAELEIHAASGFFRNRFVDGRRIPEVFPPARFRRGTWISYELISV